MAERTTRDSIKDVWGPRTPYFGEGRWPSRVDERVIEEPERWVQSACVLCTNDCALDIGVKGNKIVGVRGRAGDIVNRGRLGPKGLHGWIANDSDKRLTHPLVRRDGKLRRASWDEAMVLPFPAPSPNRLYARPRDRRPTTANLSSMCRRSRGGALAAI